MNDSKKIFPVGESAPARETKNNTNESITYLDEKIKSKIIESAYQHDGIVSFRTITDNSVVIEYRDAGFVSPPSRSYLRFRELRTHRTPHRPHRMRQIGVALIQSNMNLAELKLWKTRIQISRNAKIAYTYICLNNVSLFPPVVGNIISYF